MSYRCCINEPLASMMGVEPGGPWVQCNFCGVRLEVSFRRGPPKWLLAGKAPPGWRTVKHEDCTRTDWCPRCR